MKRSALLLPTLLWTLLQSAMAAEAEPPTPVSSAPAASLEQSDKPGNTLAASMKVAAIQACERVVSAELRELRAHHLQKLSFASEHTQVLPVNQTELSVQGTGRYTTPTRQTLSFNYRCGYHSQTHKTNGVVISDQGAPTTKLNESTLREPDISKVSSEACETAVAANLKQKYPRVGRIAFGSDAREIKATVEGHPLMQGQGGVQPAAGMHAVAFSYRCEFDPQNGQLIHTQTIEKK